METTKGKSVPDSLEMIAGWIREGLEIEVSIASCPWISSSMNPETNESMNFNPKAIYRARPRKPRIWLLSHHCVVLLPHEGPVETVELTPEVRASLEKEGLL